MCAARGQHHRQPMAGPGAAELGRSVTLITTVGLWLLRSVLGVVFEGKAPQHYVDPGEERERAEQKVKPSCKLILF